MKKFMYEDIEISNTDEWWEKHNYYFSHSIGEFKEFRKATDEYIWQFIREYINNDTEFSDNFLGFMDDLIRENDFLYNHLYKAQTDDFDIEEGWIDQDYIYKDPETNDFYALFVRKTRYETEFPDGLDFHKVIPVEETIINYVYEK